MPNAGVAAIAGPNRERGAGILTDGVLRAMIHRLGRFAEFVDPGLPLDDADRARTPAYFGERIRLGFVDCIRENREAPPILMDGLRIQQVIDAALEAAGTRRWIDVPPTHG